MNPSYAMVTDGKQFMWDGEIYQTKEEASKVQEAYRRNTFETCLVEEGGKFLLYTRRPVKPVTTSVQ